MVGAGTKDSNESNYHSDFSAMVVKTDKCGNTLWRNFYDNNLAYFYNNSVYKILSLEGFLYLLGGTQENARQSTTFVAKINEEGELIWYKTFQPNENDITSSNFFIDNNQLVIYGNHEDRHKMLIKMFVMVLDTSGALIKQKEYNINTHDSHINKIFKINEGYICMVGVDTNYTFSGETILYNWGIILCKLNNDFELTKIDTIKSNYYTNDNVIDYSPSLKKYIMYLEKWVSTDSSHRQIAFIDSSGKLEKIMDDPLNYTPNQIIGYENGWIRNVSSSLILYDLNCNKIRSYVNTFGRDDNLLHFESSSITLNEKKTGFILAGACKGCNPYDDNSNNRYQRPTAFLVDTNFIDNGKALPPIEPPKPFAAIKAFPNPALESITLQITETSAEYSIYNSMGMFISSGSMASSADISLLNMASGMYFIQLKTPQGNYIGNVKFLKK
jgi:hypothetical protein